MKLLTQFEKTKTLWILLGICIIFLLLRLPSLIEPYWYGDEGIYQVIAQAMQQGNLLYRDTWDNKPPLLYLVYAFANSDQITIRTYSLFIGLFTTINFFFLAILLFRKVRIALASALLFAVLFGSPIIEGNIANAENFMLLPIIIAGSLMYLSREKEVTQSHPAKLIGKQQQILLAAAGFLLGISFMFKTVAMFEFAAFFSFLVLTFIATHGSTRIQKKEMLALGTQLAYFVGAFLLPLILTTIYFSFQGALSDFINAVFFGNVEYVGVENSLWGMPQGLLYLKLLALVIALTLILVFFKRMPKHLLFIFLWFTFSFFSTSFSGRPYTHYLIMSLPAFCLLFGLFLQTQQWKTKLAFAVLIAAICTIALQFRIQLDKVAAYYPNVYEFTTGKKDLRSYQWDFDYTTPRDYTVASFIKSHTAPTDTIYIWGDHPQIYVMADKIPPYKYTVAYHVIPKQELIDETIAMLDEKKPKYLIVLEEAQPLPFTMPTYIIRYKIEGASIYERTF